MKDFRDLASKFGFHFVGKRTPAEILKKGSNIIKFVFRFVFKLTGEL